MAGRIGFRLFDIDKMYYTNLSKQEELIRQTANLIRQNKQMLQKTQELIDHLHKLFSNGIIDCTCRHVENTQSK
jgi:hypothetical protein|tara:strand:+ start:1740 stop:1961 length:222 start_codon:yes stop_codon:yes gene_type:complete